VLLQGVSRSVLRLGGGLLSGNHGPPVKYLLASKVWLGGCWTEMRHLKIVQGH